ncbi:winged helix-turn-helix domain-containing protein [Deinococcus sp. HMF7604]|uniref:winged helix-turn-helix domain-containing protein n=1 Tax=Deinococcus betulae TaxID=2873312 RepID=UPI001CC92799|nr:winged helix-turn-helix domain-containing protein [Deinococcus betulae]MBZ9752256.1 winged helix-turn-helix domain-containing protein [Deinococcus betulae]
MTAPLAHDADTFWHLYTGSTCAVERRRAQFLALLAERRPLPEILQVTRYSRVTAYALVGRYRELGLAGLRDGRHSNRGAPRLLSVEQQQTLAAVLHTDFEQGIVWSGKDVQDWLREQYGLTVYLGRTYEFLRAAGFTLQHPRPRHGGGDEAAKEAFKTKSS